MNEALEGTSRGVRLRRLARIDFAPVHRRPSTALLVVAAAASIALSLALAALAVHVATSVFPTTRHFSHFRVADYATLTVIGVAAACGSWPIVTQMTSSPRWLFFRLAVVATLLLWAPDGWLLLRGETPRGVAVLMTMHLAIALVTYNLLVRVAPVRPLPEAAAWASGGAGASDSRAITGGRVAPRLSRRAVVRAWSAMAVLVGIEAVVGVTTIVIVPFRRTAALVPARGSTVYLVHGGLGAVLGVGAVAVLVASTAAGRTARIGAVMGALGVGIGLGGGVLAELSATRLLGMGLMLVGVVVAGIGYLVPALEAFGQAEAARAGVPPGVGRYGAFAPPGMPPPGVAPQETVPPAAEGPGGDAAAD